MDTPSALAASEVRAELARRGASLRSLADLCDRPPMWVLRRVGPSRSIDMTLEDLDLIARALGVPFASLLSRADATPATA